MSEFYEYKKIIGDRTKMYRNVAKNFSIKRALYPGSHIDIMPSFIIPSVIYVDNFRGTIRFFNSIDSVEEIINCHKEYSENTKISFIGKDYSTELGIEQVDLIISQYAGFVGQKTKKYLRKNGILLCNDSHGDATLAYLDPDYKFIGVINHNQNVETDDLDEYFTFKRKRKIDVELVLSKMKGPKYAKEPNSYIFRKLK